MDGVEPVAFWALQRTIETASIRFGLLTGLFLALQMTSSVDYGVFLFVLIAAVALLQLLPLRGRRLVRTGRALVLGAALAASVSGVYSIPYTAASARVGTRPADQVKENSAEPGDYRVATPTNVLDGSMYVAVTSGTCFRASCRCSWRSSACCLCRPRFPRSPI